MNDASEDGRFWNVETRKAVEKTHHSLQLFSLHVDVLEEELRQLPAGFSLHGFRHLLEIRMLLTIMDMFLDSLPKPL